MKVIAFSSCKCAFSTCLPRALLISLARYFRCGMRLVVFFWMHIEIDMKSKTSSGNDFICTYAHARDIWLVKHTCSCVAVQDVYNEMTDNRNNQHMTFCMLEKCCAAQKKRTTLKINITNEKCKLAVQKYLLELSCTKCRLFLRFNSVAFRRNHSSIWSHHLHELRCTKDDKWN